MKKRVALIFVLLAVTLIIGGVGGWVLAGCVGNPAGNYTDEMKLDYRTNYADGGASTVERQETMKIPLTSTMWIFIMRSPETVCSSFHSSKPFSRPAGGPAA